MHLTHHVTTTPAASNPQTESQLLCLQPHWQRCTCITSSFHTRWSETAAPQTAIITSLPPCSFSPNVPPGLSASKQHRTPSTRRPNRTKVTVQTETSVFRSLMRSVGEVNQLSYHILSEYQPFFIHFLPLLKTGWNFNDRHGENLWGKKITCYVVK